MIEPEKGDEGRPVTYRDEGSGTREQGILHRWNLFYCFIRFGGADWSKACRRESLEWADVRQSTKVDRKTRTP